MKSFQIKKWQDNIFEDISKEGKTGEENLINAILEVAFQLAEINENRECWIDTSQFIELNKSLHSLTNGVRASIDAKQQFPFREQFTFTIFGWKVFSISKNVLR